MKKGLLSVLVTFGNVKLVSIEFKTRHEGGVEIFSYYDGYLFYVYHLAVPNLCRAVYSVISFQSTESQ